MINMTAKKRFLKEGVMLNEGESFSVRTESLASEFEARDLAKRTGSAENKAYEPATKEVDPAAGTDYNSMTVRDLKAYAKQAGVEGYSNMTKADLVAALAAKGA